MGLSLDSAIGWVGSADLSKTFDFLNLSSLICKVGIIIASWDFCFWKDGELVL